MEIRANSAGSDGSRPDGTSVRSATVARGLSSSEAAARRETSGPNRLAKAEPVSAWRLFAGQFASAIVWLLFAACVAALVLGEWVDALAIFAVVLLNAVVGFLQESRAEGAIRALEKMTAPRARVVRDGHALGLAAEDVVPGDLLLLEAGDVVAADARLLVAHDLHANEAALTGESLPVKKSTIPVAPGTPLAERTDHVFAGTSIAVGTAEVEVVATGMQTELGRIAHLLDAAKSGPTPLQERLDGVAKMLSWACLAIVAVVAVLGVWRGEGWLSIALGAVSLAVAAVPEGLGAVVTLALARGVRRLAGKQVLVRRLPSVETLGCVTVICTDKTGTLTTGVMSVRALATAPGVDEDTLLDAAAACCDAELGLDGRSPTGDPTEVALLEAAAARGIARVEIESERPRVEVLPFDSSRKYMAVARADGRTYVKGAFEVLEIRAEPVPSLVEAHTRFAAKGLRVLAVARGTGVLPERLEMLGIVAIADTPRPRVSEALARAHSAGIRTIMVTGDHPVTARAIAEELGLVRAGDPLDENVVARATAERKLVLVRDLKARGEVVAMTGDGVNDAPALREAHVGVAMGVAGTEVSREASAMVLADDDYASLVDGIREGRAVYENIRRTLVYLLAGNAGELAVMFGAALLGVPAPLLPLHLLWINLVTDSLPALALATEPASADLLEKPPRPPAAPILGRREWTSIVLTGALESALVLATYVVQLRDTGDVAAARTLAFTTLVLSELLRAFAARHATRVFHESGLFVNAPLVAVVVLSIGLQAALLLLPPARTLFDLVLPAPTGLAVAFAVALVPVTVLELWKLATRGRTSAART